MHRVREGEGYDDVPSGFFLFFSFSRGQSTGSECGPTVGVRAREGKRKAKSTSVQCPQRRAKRERKRGKN